MYPLESYADAADWLQGYIDEANELKIIPPYDWFMAPWKGQDAYDLCGVNYTVYELVGFLEGPFMDNTYVAPDVAERLKKEFGIDFLVYEE
jgi:hypothetical protein